MRNHPAPLFAACALLLAASANAQESNAGKNKAQSELKQTQAQMKAAESRAAALGQQAEKVKAELTPLQKAMVALADKIHATEQRLSEQEGELNQLQQTLDEKEALLKERRTQMGQSVDAMVEMRRVPPEAVIARPGSARDTIRAAQLLATMNEQLQREAAELQTILTELETAKKAVAEQSETVRAEREKLNAQRADLERRLSERNALQTKLLADRDSERKKLDKLSKDSKSLQELIQRLEREEARRKAEMEETARRARIAPGNAAEEARLDRAEGDAMRRAHHQMQMPAAGKITTRFGQNTADGPSRGIRIRTREEASVVAPYKGQVVFTGPFLDYGRMVIIRHAGGYHTLLAGIRQIRCSPGQTVMQGEPIGTMGGKASESELYLELRDHSTPVNPADWFSGL